MIPKCLGTCVIHPPGLSHHRCPITLLRSKAFEVPMIRCLLTPRGHLDRGSLCVELSQQSNNRLAWMLSIVFMKPESSILTSYVMSGDELHQNEHVESLSAFGLDVASSLAHLLVSVCMFVVGSDSVVACFSAFSYPWHGGVCGEQPAASGWDGSDHQSVYLGPVPELHQRQ